MLLEYNRGEEVERYEQKNNYNLWNDNLYDVLIIKYCKRGKCCK